MRSFGFCFEVAEKLSNAANAIRIMHRMINKTVRLGLVLKLRKKY